MKIIQIVSPNPGVIYGLGNDGYAYEYDDDGGLWKRMWSGEPVVFNPGVNMET